MLVSEELLFVLRDDSKRRILGIEDFAVEFRQFLTDFQAA